MTNFNLGIKNTQTLLVLLIYLCNFNFRDFFVPARRQSPISLLVSISSSRNAFIPVSAKPSQPCAISAQFRAGRGEWEGGGGGNNPTSLSPRGIISCFQLLINSIRE